MVGNDQVGRFCSPPRPLKETGSLLVVPAEFAHARIRIRGDPRPECAVSRRWEEQLGAIPCCGALRPYHDARYRLHLPRRHLAGLLQGIELTQAEVVRASFKYGRSKLKWENVLQVRYILVIELVLQIDGVGRNYHALTFSDCEVGSGNQICQRLAGACAGFDHQDSAILHGFRDRLQHVHLLWTMFIAREPLGYEAARMQ